MPEDNIGGGWGEGLTRRQFVAGAAALTASGIPGLEAAGQEALPPPKSQGDSPEITAGGVVPLLESTIARPMRYVVEDGAFYAKNGANFFGRPLYGPNIPFRVDGGDLPEFSLYLPGHGGNLRLGIENTGGKWLFEADSVEMRYANGRLTYEIRDALLGSEGKLHLDVLTQGAGFWVEARGTNVPAGTLLTWAFGGVSGHKGQRNGDIGCEKEPVSQFFQLRPDECKGNLWTLNGTSAEVIGAAGKSRIHIEAPENSELRLSDAAAWSGSWVAMWAAAAPAPGLPVLLGQSSLRNEPLRLRISVLEGSIQPKAESPETFENRREELANLANRVTWSTPNPYLDSMANALGIAADAVWDETQGCVMHGAVAWRMPLAGWRGPYALDAMGWHDRMQRHLRHWIARQNVSPINNGSSGTPQKTTVFTTITEATGGPDKGTQSTRSEQLLHSNGDLSKNHYDMNLVLFDALLRHLRWTGDTRFALEVWPALERHAAWERRLFRRDYSTDPNRPLPLYEAYAAIWASDNLQYNGGGAAHSSAYNVFLNRSIASVAAIIGKDGTAYTAEADAISHAMRELLWMPERGAFAEAKDWLGQRTLNVDPAVWTIYHTIDSEVTTPKEAWQMAAERLRALRKVPILGHGVPEGGWQLPCSDWMPYMWSLTLLCTGENLHTALALYQAGMAHEAYGLLSGTLLDAGFRGLCPGNFPMSLQLDPHRQESQRDFADPIGCASRAIVEGLWGIQPDLTRGQLTLRPQLPPEWENAEFHHPELDLAYTRIGLQEHWAVTSRLAKSVKLILDLPARTVELPSARINGTTVPFHFDLEAVGCPRIVLESASTTVALELVWHGETPIAPTLHPIAFRIGEMIRWPAGVSGTKLDDPQGCLHNGMAIRSGGATIFARMDHGACKYWLPFEVKIAETVHHPLPSHLPKAGERFEPVDLQPLLTGQVREILRRGYAEPRSKYTSLSLPVGLLGGWANFDVRATIEDTGLRGAGGQIKIANGLVFNTPSESSAPNCCYVSQWAGDPKQITLKLNGHAQALYLLMATTTFPQATRSRHALARVVYQDGHNPTQLELTNPTNWWPVEQDFLLDDYVFRLEPFGAPETPLPIRVDLKTGRVRILDRATFKGNGRAVSCGSANVLRLPLDPAHSLASLELHVELYGVVLGLLGATLGR